MVVFSDVFTPKPEVETNQSSKKIECKISESKTDDVTISSNKPILPIVLSETSLVDSNCSDATSIAEVKASKSENNSSQQATQKSLTEPGDLSFSKGQMSNVKTETTSITPINSKEHPESLKEISENIVSNTLDSTEQPEAHNQQSDISLSVTASDQCEPMKDVCLIG